MKGYRIACHRHQDNKSRANVESSLFLSFSFSSSTVCVDETCFAKLATACLPRNNCSPANGWHTPLRVSILHFHNAIIFAWETHNAATWSSVSSQSVAFTSVFGSPGAFCTWLDVYRVANGSVWITFAEHDWPAHVVVVQSILVGHHCRHSEQIIDVTVDGHWTCELCFDWYMHSETDEASSVLSILVHFR